MSATILVGAAAVAVAAALVVLVVLVPGPPRLPVDRRRPPAARSAGYLTRGADAATSVIERMLTSRRARDMTILEEAGLKTRPQDFVFLVLVGMLVAMTLGLLVSGILLGALLAVLVPVGARIALAQLGERRRKRFAEQLEEALQLMASGLRAGHSLLQSFASVAEQSEEPTASEYARILNEARVGRDLGDALAETADRMRSQDFVWVTQASAINREVGGNLADVLDGVGATIRERGQIRRTVESLAAEGKLSAVILMLLPVGIIGFLTLTNPGYLVPFTTHWLGWTMIVVSVLLFLGGGLWLRKTVQITF
jgi:tight adherence protein B